MPTQAEVVEWAFSATRLLVDAFYTLFPLFLVGFILSIFRRTRPWTGVILFCLSYLLGAATWFYGAGLAFGTWGLFGLFVGLFLFGIGVVPVGVVGAFVEGYPELGWGCLGMLAGTWFLRLTGVWLAEDRV